MLAYVFWHWKQDRIEVNRYEMLLQFHTSLTQKQPEGFIHSIAQLPSKSDRAQDSATPKNLASTVAEVKRIPNCFCSPS